MKKLLLCITLAALFSGCAQTTASHTGSSQNSVSAVLQSEIDKQNGSNTDENISDNTSDTATDTAVSAVSDTPSDPTSETVDLTEMNSTMVYSEVFAMMTEPENYMGKTVKMNGVCNRYTDIATGADYYACIITDATACCSQGIEFQLPAGQSYPQMGTNITVEGTFGSYMEGENEYYVLLNSKLL